MKKELLLELIKKAIKEIEPDADIVFYGSRATGRANAESDWDFLILVDGPVDFRRTDKIRHRLYEIEWNTGEILCSIVRNREEWQRPINKVTPFFESVERDGIII